MDVVERINACCTFADTLPEDTHVVMAPDGAGWHGTAAIEAPDNITLVPLSPYSPERDSVESIWLYLRERCLSHRPLDDFDAIVKAFCRAWHDLTKSNILTQSLTRYLRITDVAS